MNKAYIRINWENYPSISTPLNEQNLNKMDGAVSEIDDRVIVLDTTKASLVELSTLFKDVSFDEKTGIFAFTRYNGATVTFDTALEKVALNIYYDPLTEKLILPLVDGTQTEVDLSRLITEYEFLDSGTIAFQVQPDGKVTAIVKEGSIEEHHLRPDYLADIKVEAGRAQAAGELAEKSAQEAAKSETAAAESAEAAEQSNTEAQAAKEAAEAAATAAGNAAASAAANAATAQTAATEAAASAESVKQSEINAAASAAAAQESELAAAKSEQSASDSALLSKSWAIGDTGIREGENTNCSEFYCNQSHGFRDEAEQFSQSAENAVEQINKKLEMPKFDIDDDGQLLCTKNTPYEFDINDDGMLRWRIKAA